MSVESASLSSPHAAVWRPSLGLGVLWLAALALLMVAFWPGITSLATAWDEREEYSYGYLIPPIVGFLLWQRMGELERTKLEGAWWGVGVLVFAVALRAAGGFATSALLMQYGLLFALWGLAASYLGRSGLRVAWVPLAFLAFMVPLPQSLYINLSSYLQLISSEIGVAIIRAFGISVYLDGNVIDLGTMKLQVVDACSGLRYLFSLGVLGMIAAYFFNGPLWKKVVIVLSTLPIAVLMNSLRIGLVGVTVEHWGPAAAEGVLHDFEGFVVFGACMAVLLVEMAILARVGTPKMALRDAFRIDFPTFAPKGTPTTERAIPKPFVPAVALLAVAAVAGLAMPERKTFTPPREELAAMPMTLGEWQGRRDRIEQIYLDILKPDDYLLADFRNPAGATTNLYIAYFAAQTKAATTHSPRLCMPGAGWTITSFEERALAGLQHQGGPMVVNRAVIQKGDQTALVYYWFKERDRVVTGEYLVKGYIFWDAITRNRSDGALVRLVTAVDRGEDIAKADARLLAFAQALAPALPRHLPD